MGFKPEDFYAELEVLGEQQVRDNLAYGTWNDKQNRLNLAQEWLKRKGENRSAAAAHRDETRKDESLNISREALRVSVRAQRLSISALVLSLAMALLAVIKWLGDK